MMRKIVLLFNIEFLIRKLFKFFFKDKNESLDLF